MRMFKIKADPLKNGKDSKEHQVEFDDASNRSGKLDGKNFSWDVITVKEGSFHVLHEDRSYNIEVLKKDEVEKTFTIRVNSNTYTLQVKDKYDELLHTLGLDSLAGKKVNEVKAPMPGLVLDVRVEEGREVKKGDALVVLEAMKMENILKSPVEGRIKKIHVKKGIAVEKNQVLVSFV